MPKVSGFTLEFLIVENLRDGCEVYLQWSRREKTRAVVVSNSIADFTGEIAHREAEAKTGGIRSWFHRHTSVVHLPDPMVIYLRQKRPSDLFGRGDRTLGSVTIDFAQYTNARKQPLALTFANGGSAIVSPVLRLALSCSWAETTSAAMPAPSTTPPQAIENPQDRPAGSVAAPMPANETTTAPLLARGPSPSRSPAPPAVSVK